MTLTGDGALAIRDDAGSYWVRVSRFKSRVDLRVSGYAERHGAGLGAPYDSSAARFD
jgi:hypothetical protein